MESWGAGHSPCSGKWNNLELGHWRKGVSQIMVMNIKWIDCLLEFWGYHRVDMRLDIERLHPSKKDTLASKSAACAFFDRGFCSPTTGSKLHRWNGTTSPISRVMRWRRCFMTDHYFIRPPIVFNRYFVPSRLIRSFVNIVEKSFNLVNAKDCFSIPMLFNVTIPDTRTSYVHMIIYRLL